MPATARKSTKAKSSRNESRDKTTTSAVADAMSTVMEKTKDAAQGIQQRISSYFQGIEVEFDSLRDLYVKELQDLYSAEKQLVDALPKLVEAASSADLRRAFQEHLTETEGQVARLEKVFKEMGLQPKSTKCKAMQGLIAEGSEWMGERAQPGVMDAGLIAAAQRVEHYEIAGYGCVRTYAQLLGHDKAATLLQQTLDEEGAADKKLTQLAKRINVQAEGGRMPARVSNGHRKSTAKPRKGR